MNRQNIMPESMQRPEWMGKLCFNASRVWHGKEYLRLLSHGLVHADLLHLAFNMFTLYYFGKFVEEVYSMLPGGRLLYLVLYVTALAVSSSVDLVRHKDHPGYNAVGASGAVSAVLFASILLAPTNGIMIFLIPIPIPAWLFGILYLGYCFYMARRGGDNIGHTAHAVGAVYGFLFLLIIKPSMMGQFFHALTN